MKALIKGSHYKVEYKDIEGSLLFEGKLIQLNAGYRRNLIVFYNKENEQQLIVSERDIINIEN